MIFSRLIAGYLLVLGLALAQDCFPKASTSEPRSPAYFRYSFLVDTSASMVGRGDGRAVIFPQLQERLLEFVRAIRGKAEVWLTPFNQGTAPTARFRLPEDRQNLESYISGLEANGANTWLYRSMQDVFAELPSDPAVGNVVYILSDGIDNDAQRPMLNRVLQEYQSKRGPNDFLYYVGLGQTVPVDIQTAFATIPMACTLGAAVGEVPVFAHATVSPNQVDLGNFKLEPGTRNIALSVQVFGLQAPLKVFYQDEAPERARGRLQIEPAALVQGQEQLRFRLSETDLLPNGNYSGHILLSGPTGTVVTPAAIPVRWAFHPGAVYRLVWLEGSRDVVLSQARKHTLRYRLEGNEWAVQPIILAFDRLPQGLEARFNGQTGSIRLKPGQQVEIELLNQGTGDAADLQQMDWKVVAPAGASLELPKPLTLRPRANKQWLWWLLTALLVVLVGGWLWRRPNPRRIRQRIPTVSKEFSSPYASLLTPSADGPRQLELREGQLVNLGVLWGNPLLQGLLLLGTASGVQVEEIPEGVTLLTQESLEVGAILPFNEVVRLYSEEGLIGSFVVINPRQATLIRWGKATFTLSESRPVSFDLGGLGSIDLGHKLNISALLGMTVILSKGGLRLLQLPQGIRARIGQETLQTGDRIPFEQPVQLEDVEAKPIGEISFSPLEGVPVPLAYLRYLGGRPEQRRRLVSLVEAIDIGQATGEQTLERLQLLPLPEGVRVEHIPGNLRLTTFVEDIRPGDTVGLGQSVFLYDLSSKASLGVIDVVEP
ncbi:vWA domain-containing protein [Meiothermus sp.]|uniref:vWA domain-containing protein n=1 Tax=Meiothermus sp. TaxID=1955249 RepID=UPI00307CC998